MSHQQNITRIKATSNALGAFAKDVVFVGGATVSLYTDRPADEVRPTESFNAVYVNKSFLYIFPSCLNPSSFSSKSRILTIFFASGIISLLSTGIT